MDSAGNPISVTPLYATADGGVTATSTQTIVTHQDPLNSANQDLATRVLTTKLGILYSIDANGNSIGQIADTGAVYSWGDDWYMSTAVAPSGAFSLSSLNSPSPGGETSLQLVWKGFLDWEHSWSAFFGGNPANTKEDLNRCAPLDRATTTTIENAFSFLKTFLSNSQSCPDCDSRIFKTLNIKRSDFVKYLEQTHRFCDGTKSQEPGATINEKEVTVEKAFQRFRANNEHTAAVTVPSGPSKPLWIFFDPKEIVNDSSRVDPHLYPSTLFHEALHGFTKLGDGDPIGFHGFGLCQIFEN